DPYERSSCAAVALEASLFVLLSAGIRGRSGRSRSPTRAPPVVASPLGALVPGRGGRLGLGLGGAPGTNHPHAQRPCSARARAASRTERIRVGSGGIMLPNHSPLAVIEQFGTLVRFHGDRIDLGLGRAPGTDQLTAQLLARTSAEPAAFIAAVEQMRDWSRAE